MTEIKDFTMTEQDMLDVEFRIVELLHIYDFLNDAADSWKHDTYKTAELEYLQNRIFAMLPAFKESDDYYKGILHQTETGRMIYKKYYPEE